MKKKFFLWFFLLIFLTTYNYHGKKKSFPNFFFIKQIEIVGVKNSNKEELELRLDKIRSKNIIFLSEKDFKEAIKDMNFINSLEIKKIYPKKIFLNLTIWVIILLILFTIALLFNLF